MLHESFVLKTLSFALFTFFMCVACLAEIRGGKKIFKLTMTENCKIELIPYREWRKVNDEKNVGIKVSLKEIFEI